MKHALVYEHSSVQQSQSVVTEISFRAHALPEHRAMPEVAGSSALDTPAFEAATQYLQAAAADSPVGIPEVELLRRAFMKAREKADGVAAAERAEEERKRRANEPTAQMIEDAKWSLFDTVWQGDAARVSELSLIHI